MAEFKIKKAISEYFSLVRLISGKTFGGARKIVAVEGYANYTDVRNRSFIFQYKSLCGVIFQDDMGLMQINDFLFVYDTIIEQYVPFYSVEHMNDILHVS